MIGTTVLMLLGLVGLMIGIYEARSHMKSPWRRSPWQYAAGVFSVFGGVVIVYGLFTSVGVWLSFHYTLNPFNASAVYLDDFHGVGSLKGEMLVFLDSLQIFLQHCLPLGGLLLGGLIGERYKKFSF